MTHIVKVFFTIVSVLVFISCNDGTTLKGEIVLKAYREGTQSQDVLYLSNNGEYEVHSSGAFFYDNRVKGKYKKSIDTLFLYNVSEKNRLLSDTMLMKEGVLYRIMNDSICQSHFKLIK